MPRVLITGMSGTGKSSRFYPSFDVEFEPLLRAGADVEIVTTVPLETVATEVERIADVAPE